MKDGFMKLVLFQDTKKSGTVAVFKAIKGERSVPV
jgi:hypothetical protein